MRHLLNTFVVGLLIAAPLSQAATASAPAESPSLEEQLELLQAPENQAPPVVDSERLYAVQTRYASLQRRHEFAIGGARNFTPDSYTVSQQLDLAYRYYIDDRWFVGLTGSYVFNDLSDSGQRLFNDYDLLPDVAFARYRGDLMAGYNLFYGKFRVSMDQVFYFDQYVALGPGLVNFNSGNQIAAVADVGVVGWIGRNFSIRLGIKDYFVKEVRQKSEGWAHNFLGHLEFGYLL